MLLNDEYAKVAITVARDYAPLAAGLGVLSLAIGLTGLEALMIAGLYVSIEIVVRLGCDWQP